jgi:purine-binding chemotaxis protein CheW
MPAVETTRQLVVCALGAEHYALPIEQVREVVRASDPRPVPSEQPWMRGVINLRGTLVPVHDLAARLGLACPPPDPARTKIVIADLGGEPAGFVVDDMVEVLTVADEQLETVDGAPIAKLGQRLVLLLDVAELDAR